MMKDFLALVALAVTFTNVAAMPFPIPANAHLIKANFDLERREPQGAENNVDGQQQQRDIGGKQGDEGKYY